MLFYKQIQLRLNRVETFRKLKAEPKEFWIQLLNAYFVGTNYVVVSVILAFQHQYSHFVNLKFSRNCYRGVCFTINFI